MEMAYVALVLVVGLLAVGFVSLANLLRWQIRQAARREHLLVNQICALSGKPWDPPPAWEEEEREDESEVLIASPEQMSWP